MKQAGKRKTTKRLSLRQLEKEVHGVLMDLMCESDSDSVRVAAARALIDKINKEQNDGKDEHNEHKRERDEYIAEARGLLTALAALKSPRCAGKITVA